MAQRQRRRVEVAADAAANGDANSTQPQGEEERDAGAAGDARHRRNRGARRQQQQESRPGLCSRCFHIGKYVILLLLLPAILNHASLFREAEHLKPEGQMYDVGWNHKLFLSCSGEGSPTVILDAPTGMSLDVWYLVQTRIAKFTRVCSYDRAGIGFSERVPLNFTSEERQVVNPERGQENTIERMVEDLHYLVTISSDQPKPFILVGSELGSLNARFFAQMYESEVSDIVLIDPLVESLFEVNDGVWNEFWFEHLVPSLQSLQLSASIGIMRIALLLGMIEQPITGQVISDEVQNRQKYLMCYPRHLSTSVDEHYFINVSLSQIRTVYSVKPFPRDVSVTVITGNYYDEQLPSTLNKAWAKAQQHLISNVHPGCKHIVVNGADHHMLYRNPNAVVEPIKKIVNKWRQRSNNNQEQQQHQNSEQS
ncbi:uncharacterized protein [Amphiura filiformis]|uniref:uncharacterized protein n=1 Tax=Amphiura filiformis TaxID=82378 RepID=UPI003B2178F2